MGLFVYFLFLCSLKWVYLIFVYLDDLIELRVVVGFGFSFFL